MTPNIYQAASPLQLEIGSRLENWQLAYHTAGQLNASRDNVVWVCHAFSANSNISEWWPELIGPGKLLDPTTSFIVCANLLGSCYGSTGPLSENPATGTPYFSDFPLVTIQDQVRAMDSLRQHLGIRSIAQLIGGSMGGQQAVEWAVQKPALIEQIILIASNARHSPWGIAFNEAQRLAIYADPSYKENTLEGGLNGMKAARATALLSYRNYNTYHWAQYDEQRSINKPYKAVTYQQYQGEKLAQRFNAYSYVAIANMMDSHDVGRGRGGLEAALGRVEADTLVIGISTDILFPTSEQKLLAEFIPGAEYVEIESVYGHDGFLTESYKITDRVRHYTNRSRWLKAS